MRIFKFVKSNIHFKIVQPSYLFRLLSIFQIYNHKAELSLC